MRPLATSTQIFNVTWQMRLVIPPRPNLVPIAQTFKSLKALQLRRPLKPYIALSPKATNGLKSSADQRPQPKLGLAQEAETADME